MLPTPDPSSVFSDRQLLLWGRSLGIDLKNRSQLLDAAAVGLTVSAWRNTRLEHIHAGWEQPAEGSSIPGDDLPEGIAVADPAEAPRITAIVDGARAGFGIRDDVMLRMNVSTTRAIRELLETEVPADAHRIECDFGRAGEDPLWYLWSAIELLSDPDREIAVGTAAFTAAEIFGDTWDDYVIEMTEKQGRLIGLSDTVSARTGLWFTALSGASYATAWWGNAPWAAAVDRLEAAVAGGDATATQYVPAELGWVPVDPAFWEALRTAPETLCGAQATWLMCSELTTMVHDIQRETAAGMGHKRDEDRFPIFAAIF